MQKFLIPIMISALSGWALCFYIIFFTLPQNSSWVIIFLSTLLITVALTLAIALYILKSYRASPWMDKRALFRDSVLMAFPIALSLPLYLGIRYIAVDTWYTVSILLLLILFSEYQILKRVS